MTWNSEAGKSGLIKELMAKGFSARKAEKAVNAFFECIKAGLWRGEVVELPVGKLVLRIRNGQRPRVWQRSRNVQTGKIKFGIRRMPGPHKVVKLIPNLALDLFPLPTKAEQAAAAVKAAEDAEIAQLASELLGEPARQDIIASLQRCVDSQTKAPGALVRRLRDLKSRGRKYSNEWMLGADVRQLYWL